MFKRLYLTAIVVVGIILLAELCLFAANLRTRRRAELLLKSVRTFKLGTSTLTDLEPILNAYNAEKVDPGSNCPSADTTYGLTVSNPTISRIGYIHPALLRLGIRPMSASLTASFKKGHLCEFRYGEWALIARSQYPFRSIDVADAKLLQIGAETVMQSIDGDGAQINEHYNVTGYSAFLRNTTWPGRTLALRVAVTPNASPMSIAHAFAFDLGCFTSLRGCRARCQMLPLVFRDIAHSPNTTATPIISEEARYENCSFLVE